jgi:hypothetical protein
MKNRGVDSSDCALRTERAATLRSLRTTERPGVGPIPPCRFFFGPRDTSNYCRAERKGSLRTSAMDIELRTRKRRRMTTPVECVILDIPDGLRLNRLGLIVEVGRIRHRG